MSAFDIILYDYSLTQRWACPDCYKPVGLPKRGKDGRCRACQRAVRQPPPEPRDE